MNIDVREYLRINPISVHDLTLSEDGKDCFLIFGNAQADGYRAVTQNEVFRTLYQRIFGDLLNSDLSGFNLLSSTNPPTWNVCNLTDDQFPDFVRKSGSNQSAYSPYKDAIESWLTGLENAVEAKIRALRLRAKTWSQGAVEYKANSYTPYYDHSGDDYQRLNGITWCYDQSGADISGKGKDMVELPEPIKHSHPKTRAETLTVPYTTKRGGGDLIADCGVGVKDMVSYSNWSKPRAALTPKQDFILADDDELTQPLYGQNILDWRNRQRAHNNIPPSANVFAMRVRHDMTSVHPSLVQRGIADIVEVAQETRDAIDKPVSYVAAQYYSSTVQDLEQFGEDDLTTHDYMLRILHKNGQAIELMKQTVKMLIEIFGRLAFDTLGIKDNDGKLLWTMEDILKLKLDELLVPKHEFANWYNGIVDRMSKLNDRIQLYRQMLRSIKPLNYVGRIVMSSTDDTEQKVIRNYGGRKWRRIVNFLRGVVSFDELGTKMGEEYVCLRESNIPVHTHAMTTAESPSPVPVGQMKKDSGSDDTKIVDVGQSNGGIKLQNRTLDYQISPLEYRQTDMILPHDNMPPYREAYFWECLDPTDDEVGLYVVTWDANCELPSPEPMYYSSRTKEKLGTPPTPRTRTGYVFDWWYDDEGNRPDPNWEVDRSIVYHARWNANEYTITFNHNNGTPPFSETRTRHYGEKVGVTPEPRRPNIDERRERVEFEGWFNSKTGGTKITKDTKVTGNATYYAHWNRTQLNQICNVTFDAMGGKFSNDEETYVIQRDAGTGIGSLPSTPIKSNYGFDQWWTKPRSGKQVTSSTIVNEDVTFYAHWTANQFRIDYNLMGGTLPTGRTNPTEYTPDTNTFTLVNPSKVGHTFRGWSGTGIPSGQYLVEVTIPRGSSGYRTYTANWTATGYSILYNMNGHGVVPTAARREYTIGDLPYTPPSPSSIVGYTFTGWSPANIPAGSTGSKEFSAIWQAKRHTATFNANGGTGGTTKTQDYGTALYAPRVSRTGYTFEEWIPSVPSTMPDEDCTFTARWQATTYTITFDANGGDGGKVVSLPHGAEVDIPGTTREGYSLVGWFTEPTGGEKITSPITVTGDATYYARWEISQYEVIYDTNGVEVTVPNTSDYPRTHTIDDTITPPPLATTRPYRFIEWVPRTMPYGTVGDQTFMAQWEIEYVTVTFNANGGKFSDDTHIKQITQDYGTELTAPTVTRNGYTFNSWNPSVPPTMPAENCTYTAQWRQICTVTFNVVNDKATAVPSRQVLSGQSVGELPSTSLPPPQGNLAGMNFAGWWTSEDGGEEVTSSTIVSSNVTYYAHWEGVIYYQKVSRNTPETVSIDSNGVASGFYGSAPDNVQRALESIPTTKFDFSGAFTIVMKCQVTQNRQSSEEGGRWDVFGGHSVDGCYNHFCDFGIFGGNINGGKSSQWEIASAYDSNLPSGVPCSVGDGWNTSVDQTEPIYLKVIRDFYNENWRIRCYLSTDGINWNQETVNNNAMQPLGIGQFCIGTDPDSWSEYFPGKIFLNDCYLLQENSNSTQPKGKYILRKKNSETTMVTLDPQGGYDGDTSVLAIRGQAMPQITIPTNEGHTFTGYYEQTGGLGAQYYNPDGGSNRNWDKSVNTATLYAHWTANQYTATFNANGGVGGKTVTQNYGTALSAPTVTRTGYTFNGWNPSVPSTMPVNGGTYVAQWTANTYQVTFNKQNGTGGSNSVTATYGSAMPQATMPTRTGYVFGGYYDGANGAGIQYYNSDGTSAITWDKTSDTTLYAKWIEDRIEVTYHRNFTEQEQEDTEN